MYTAEIDNVSTVAVAWLKKLSRKVVPTAYTYVATTGIYPSKFINKYTFYSKRMRKYVGVKTYEEGVGAIDHHTKSRQGKLGLEKRWVTTRWDFRIITSVIGICVVDA